MQNLLKSHLLLQDYMSNLLIPFWNSYSLFQTLSRCSFTHLCWLDVLHYLFTCFLQTVEKSKTYCIIFKSANIVMVISYRDTREALYFCVTLTEQLFLQIWRVDLNYFLDVWTWNWDLIGSSDAELFLKSGTFVGWWWRGQQWWTLVYEICWKSSWNWRWTW